MKLPLTSSSECDNGRRRGATSFLSPAIRFRIDSVKLAGFQTGLESLSAMLIAGLAGESDGAGKVLLRHGPMGVGRGRRWGEEGVVAFCMSITMEGLVRGLK